LTGGIDLAAEWAGFETVGQCEFADYPTKVLEKHWPDVPRWRDVRDVTIESVRERIGGRITLLSGGFPCQPHSLAGKRQASCDERDLWGEFARLICEIKPRWVLGENVTGLLSSESGRIFGRILRDLAELGYDVGWCGYPAYAVGGLFAGERIFIIATTSKERSECITEKQIHRFSTLSPQFQRSIKVWADGWDISKPVVYRVRHGIPNWMDRIGSLGNAVVPQQVYPILQAIADIEKEANHEHMSSTRIITQSS
jgi:DNA (cytosine-5)-methyltransferase 1